MSYAWRPGSRFTKVDANEVGRELEQIETKNSTTIVEWARINQGSALYKCFEWSDTKAAELYRNYQARTLLGSIAVTVEIKSWGSGKPETVEIRAYEAIETKAGGLKEYIKTTVALKDDGMRDIVIGRLRSGIASLEDLGRKYDAVIGDSGSFFSGLTTASTALAGKAE